MIWLRASVWFKDFSCVHAEWKLWMNYQLPSLRLSLTSFSWIKERPPSCALLSSARISTTYEIEFRTCFSAGSSKRNKGEPKLRYKAYHNHPHTSGSQLHSMTFDASWLANIFILITHRLVHETDGRLDRHEMHTIKSSGRRFID